MPSHLAANALFSPLPSPLSNSRARVPRVGQVMISESIKRALGSIQSGAPQLSLHSQLIGQREGERRGRRVRGMGGADVGAHSQLTALRPLPPLCD